MRAKHFIIAAAIMFVCSCVQLEPLEPPKPFTGTPVSMHFMRNGAVLDIDIVIPEKEWGYTSVLSDDGMKYTLVVKELERPLGSVEPVRPVVSYERTDYPSGFRLIFSMASRQKLDTFKSDLGLRIRLTSLEPDMEIYSMENFGGWAEPVYPAHELVTSDEGSGTTVLTFDRPPLYATGEAGGRYYLDVFNVRIGQGIVRYKGLAAVNAGDEKTRLIFRNRTDFCPDDKTITIGKACKGYSGLSGFTRDINAKTESFQFTLPGMPAAETAEREGLIAFGFKDTELFSKVFQRYTDGGVYKVEARRKDGMLWLIFLHDGEMKWRKYYSGDKFFVVFYR